MRHVTVLLTFLLFAAAGFAATEESLLGRWRWGDSNYQCTLEFKKDGLFAGSASRQGKTIWEFSGNWELRDDTIFYTYKKSSLPKIKSGYQEQDRVITATKDFIELESTKDSKKLRYERVN